MRSTSITTSRSQTIARRPLLFIIEDRRDEVSIRNQGLERSRDIRHVSRKGGGRHLKDEICRGINTLRLASMVVRSSRAIYRVPGTFVPESTYDWDLMVRTSGVLIPRAVDRRSEPSFSSKDFLNTIVLNVRSAFMVFVVCLITDSNYLRFERNLVNCCVISAAEMAA
jgi:hypothetical protein